MQYIKTDSDDEIWECKFLLLSSMLDLVVVHFKPVKQQNSKKSNSNDAHSKLMSNMSSRLNRVLLLFLL